MLHGVWQLRQMSLPESRRTSSSVPTLMFSAKSIPPLSFTASSSALACASVLGNPSRR